MNQDDDDSSDEDVWSSMPTLDEPPKKSESKNLLNKCIIANSYNSRAQKICQKINYIAKY